jgi:phosphatidylcholine synthase
VFWRILLDLDLRLIQFFRLEVIVSYSTVRKLLAWGVHIFTASGLIVGLLALVAIVNRDWRAAFLWIFVAVLIDTIDGRLARTFRVKEVLPNVDGRMLDYVTDFTNDVLLPTLFLYEAGLLPSSVRLVCCAAILLVSCYHYTNLKAITDDFRFRGFPAMWNFVVFYLFVLGLSPLWNVVIIGIFCCLHFTPIDFIYPTRTVRLKKLTFALVLLLAVVNLIILIQQPLRNSVLLVVSLLIVGYLMAISLYQTYVAHNRGT